MVFTSKKNVYVQGAAVYRHAHTSVVATQMLQIIQNCEDHYDCLWRVAFRNGNYVSGFYETRGLKPFDSQMKPKEIWAFTSVTLLVWELEGGDGWGSTHVLTACLFVTDR